MPIWQGLEGFQRLLRHCALDESSLSFGRVKDLLTSAIWIFLLLKITLLWNMQSQKLWSRLDASLLMYISVWNIFPTKMFPPKRYHTKRVRILLTTKTSTDQVLIDTYGTINTKILQTAQNISTNGCWIKTNPRVVFGTYFKEKSYSDPNPQFSFKKVCELMINSKVILKIIIQYIRKLVTEIAMQEWDKLQYEWDQWVKGFN